MFSVLRIYFVFCFQIFYRNQEPGEILNNLQRCSAKFLQMIEEKQYCDNETGLKLFSAFIYFSSPTQRTKFRKDVDKYVDTCEDLESWFVLKKLLSYVKVSDRKLCQRYWSLALKLLEERNKLGDVIRVSQSYMSFNIDVPNFRHLQFEKIIFRYIEDALNNQEFILYTGMTVFLCFCLKYDAKPTLLLALTEKLENNVYHLQSIHYLQLIECLDEINSHPREIVSRIKRLLDDVRTNLVQSDKNLWQTTMLAKAMAVQGDMENYNFESLLYSFKEMNIMCSKILESVCNIFLTSSCIIPEVLNKCTEYVVNHPDNIVGFNAEKILYACYFLGYYPLNDEKFFKVVADIIFR